MKLSHQVLFLVTVSVLLGLGARFTQKRPVPFWGFPKPIEMVQPKVAMADPAVSADSAFVPSDKPYRVDFGTTSVLWTKRKKASVHFVDARETKLYVEGHIPGALNIPFEHVGEYSTMLNAIPKTELILIYCDGGDCHLSNDLAQHMLQDGWKRVAVYEGGWEEWSKETDFVATGSTPEEAN